MSGFGRAIALEPGAGRSFSIGPDTVSVKGATSDAEGGFAMIEYRGAPNNPGPGMHLHRTFEECWFILEGEVDFRLAGEVVRARAGSFLLVPRGVPHGFDVVGSAPARWIGIFSPSRYMGLIEESADLVASGAGDEAWADLFARYDTEMVG